MTKKYTALTKRECADRLLNIEKPTVAMHIHPDADTVGTAAALIAVYRQLGINARYICSDKVPERLSFLLDGAESATVQNAGTVISVDTASPAQLGELYKNVSVEFMIDHHEVGEPYAPYHTVGGASSAAEVLFGIIIELCDMGKIELTREIAEPLYAAISSDTGRFSYSSATADTYRVAARLIEAGADHARINHLLFSSKSKDQISAEGIAASKTVVYFDGLVAAATLSKEDRCGIAFEHFETAIDIVRSVRGAEIAFIVKETDDGKIKASLRSTHYDVASIAKEFSGGGHRLAAGCTVEAENVTIAKDILLEKIKKTIGL